MATSPYITDVTQENFETAVIARSREVPVLVDFWAAWCGPCQTLMPILAKLAEEYQGRFFLAKVDSDEEQALAGRFGVRNLPTVKLFKNGTEAAEFLGAQPERTIRALLDKHIDRPSDKLLQKALDEEGLDKRGDALATLREAHEADPQNDRVTVHLARVLCEEGHIPESEHLLKGLPRSAQSDPELTSLLARMEFLRLAAQAPPLAVLERTVAENPRDMQARLQLGARYLLLDRSEEALMQWLDIVRTDRNFHDDIGRRMLLSAFTLLGGKGDLVRKYRGLLTATIT